MTKHKRINPFHEQYIICAAILFLDGKRHHFQPYNIKKGFVIAGRRHHNIYDTIKTLSKKYSCDWPLAPKVNPSSESVVILAEEPV